MNSQLLDKIQKPAMSLVNIARKRGSGARTTIPLYTKLSRGSHPRISTRPSSQLEHIHDSDQKWQYPEKKEAFFTHPRKIFKIILKSSSNNLQ